MGQTATLRVCGQGNLENGLYLPGLGVYGVDPVPARV
jgi:hypothetical protein